MLAIQSILKPVNTLNTHLSNPNASITHLLTDSRLLQHPKNTLFFALKGRLNGHDFIAELLKKGVRNFVVSDDIELITESVTTALSGQIDTKLDLTSSRTDKVDGLNIIQVPDVKQALQTIAKQHRAQFNYPVIGVTGSNGKTIVKEWLFQILKSQFNVVRNSKSYNSQIGVPLSVWQMQKEHNLGIFEAGISFPNEMEKLENIIKPNIGIFTNIGSAHSENFVSNQQKIEEKLKLFVNAETIIYCEDHSGIHSAVKEKFPNKTCLAWSFKNENTKFFFKLYNQQLSLKTKENKLQFKLPFNNKASIENICHCIVLALNLDLSEADIQTGINQVSSIEMRLELKPATNNCVVINDTYNSDLESLKVALEFMQSQKKIKQTLVLSDIQQTGVPKGKLYKQVAGILKPYQLNHLFTVGSDSFELNKYNCANHYLHTNNLNHLKQSLAQINLVNEAILIKGARHFRLEQLSELFIKKKHETVFEVNLNALHHNLAFFGSFLTPKTKTMAMVKALAYGTGKDEIAKLLEYLKVDYLGVAFTDEGVELRKSGITLPIMILNPNEPSFFDLLHYHLEPQIYSIKLLHKFLRFLDENNVTKLFPIHINLDTGMHRLGFEEHEIDNLISLLKNNPQIEVKSVMSHLTSTDNPKHDKHTLQQIAGFTKMANRLAEAVKEPFIRHIVNSSGIVRFPEAQFDMVRLGIGLYGINDFYQDKLQFVGKLKTHISQIKTIKQGETIGYNRMGVAKQAKKIATLPIGYADGLNRALSNGVGEVFLHNKRAKIIGNVCMDMVMIDISNIPQAKEGDEVEIFGSNIRIEEVAKKLNTIPYEILTSISPRVKRVFVKE